MSTFAMILACIGFSVVVLAGMFVLSTVIVYFGVLFMGLWDAIKINKKTNKLIPLRDYPKGLFVCDDTLCVKTEYGNEAYIVWSGEYFWGGAKTKEEIGDVLILPIPDKVVQKLEKKYRYKRSDNNAE